MCEHAFLALFLRFVFDGKLAGRLFYGFLSSYCLKGGHELQMIINSGLRQNSANKV